MRRAIRRKVALGRIGRVRMRRVLGGVAKGVASLTVLGGVAWLWLALGFHLAGGALWAWRCGGIAAGLGALWSLWTGRRWLFWGVSTLAIAATVIWWSSLEPRYDRDWAMDGTHGVTGQIGADGRVTLTNLRNHDWISPTSAVERWETRVVDPDRITSLDLILSTWDSPEIAHTLVSFGFDDGQHVVFSLEIRKERDEAFSAVAGFFRQYEQVLIAADERDILRLRTDVRGETVSLYPVTLDPARRRALFLAFVDLGNDLAVHPRWYNTLTGNCTTVPFRLVQGLSDRVGLNLQVLLSGRLPAYLDQLGVLPAGVTLDEARRRALLHPLGPAPADGAEYSRRLRAGWAG